MRFRKMFLKDCRLEALSFLVYIGFVFALAWLVHFRLTVDTLFRFLILYLIPVGILPLYIALRSIQTLRTEWSESTIQWVLSFPVGGRLILGAKTLAIAFQAFILVAAATILAIPLIPPNYLTAENLLSLGKTGAMTFVAFCLLIPLVQFSYLVGRLLPLGAIGSFVAFALTGWAWIKSTEVVSGLIPEIPVRLTTYIADKGVSPQTLQSNVNLLPLLWSILIASFLFALSVYIWDRRTDA